MEPRVIDHGPSNIPPEDDEVLTPLLEATIADPSGFPVHLYNASDAEQPQGVLCGVRLATDNWKKSQEWWESELGWKTLRWQSNVPREASLAVLLGGPEAEGVVGPVGPASAEQPATVSIQYDYGCRPYEGESGLEAIVLSAGDGAEEKLCDPNDFPIVLGA